MSAEVVVAIPTYRRPTRLDALLHALAPQIADSGAEVLVVDNDPDGSAADVARAHGARYVAEPARGLAAVRNRSIDAADGARALVFIDDDETPADGWLVALVDRWREASVAAVSGRVETRFPRGFDDPWIRAGGFFTRVRFADRAPQPVAATNNLLLDLDFLAAQGLRFDEAFGMSGGEDIRLTSQIVAAGGLISSCPAALVLDDVDPDRLTRRWVLRRAFRVGVTSARVDLAASPSLARRLRWATRGVARVVAGGLQRTAGVVVRSVRHRARGARAVHRGAGMVAGALGGDYAEYARR